MQNKSRDLDINDTLKYIRATLQRDPRCKAVGTVAKLHLTVYARQARSLMELVDEARVFHQKIPLMWRRTTLKLWEPLYNAVVFSQDIIEVPLNIDKVKFCVSP